MPHFVFILLLAILVPACGGGKSSDDPTPTRRRGPDITSQLAGIYTVSPSLRADGQSILYQSYTDGKLYLLQRPLGQDTGTPQAVTFASDVGVVRNAKLSPDGASFLVVGATAPNLYTLYLVDVATFTPIQVVQGTASLSQLQFSSDSLLFLYTQLALDGTNQSFIGRVADPAGAAAILTPSSQNMATAIYFQNGAYQILFQVADINTLETGFFPISLDPAALASADAFTQAVSALQQSFIFSLWTATYVMALSLPAAYVSQNSIFLWTTEVSTQNFQGLGSSPDLTLDPTLGFGEALRTPSIQLGLAAPYTIGNSEWPLGFQTLKASVSRAEDGLGLSVDREFHVCKGQTKDQAVYGTGFVLRTQDSGGVATKTWLFPTAQNTVGTDPCLGVGSAQSLRIYSIALNEQAVRATWRGVFTWALGKTLQQGVVETVNGQSRIFFLP